MKKPYIIGYCTGRGLNLMTRESAMRLTHVNTAFGHVSDGLLTPAADGDETDDIVSTLLALGYSEREAKAAVKGIPKGTDVGEGVRLALKNLLK